ncbi:MAG: hypothetical protein IPK71_07990 [Myxococcales bacterium]|nr:hypothetical protein [Myxococcales bacterium]
MGDVGKQGVWARRAMTFVVVGLGVLGVVLGVHSLLLPFGDDQGLYFYVAREWRHGLVPYRDVFDHKPPGIYVVHRIAQSLFGESLASSKIVELGAVLALGLVATRLVVPRGRRVPRGLYAASATLASLAHYGHFDFWNSYQTEIWYTLFGMAAIAAALHVKALRRAFFVFGLLASLGVLMKPMSVLYSGIGGLVLGWRVLYDGGRQGTHARLMGAARSALGLVPWAVLGAGLPLVLVVAYFGAHGAMGAMIDIVVHGNKHYAKAFKNVTTLADVVRLHRDELTFLGVLGQLVVVTTLARVALGAMGRRRELFLRGGLGLALIVAASAAVTVQQKFFGVHWVTAFGPLTFGLVALVYEGRHALEKRLGPALATALPVALIGAGYMCTPYDLRVLSREQGAVLDLVTGQATREQFARRFYSPPMGYYQVDVDAVSAYLKAHARPGDRVCVRGFDTQIYAQTGLRYGGRFFWTNYIWHPKSYRHHDFVAEDHAYFEKARPRFVVTEVQNRGRGMLESRETYYPLGYVEVMTTGSLDVLELHELGASR